VRGMRADVHAHVLCNYKCNFGTYVRYVAAPNGEIMDFNVAIQSTL
jgi:hypothetical protein